MATSAQARGGDGPPDGELVERLRNKDSTAFAELVDRYASSMLRVAQAIVRSRSVAEEVVQETWVAVLRGIGKFEGRSSLKTWMFRILTNRARTRATRESRTLPASALGKDDDDPIDLDRFDQNGMWKTPPDRWHGTPEKSAVDQEMGAELERAIEQLPERQRMVLVLRDVQGWSSEEVRNVMDIGETNQRVLLHRARTKVRNALASYLEGKK